nr:putative integron gene cassette protein [uncultured bacterium]
MHILLEWTSAGTQPRLRRILRSTGSASQTLSRCSSNPLSLTMEDEGAEGEQRFISIGLDAGGRVVVVVYTHRDDEIRLVSARLASRSESLAYEKGI